MNSDKANGGNAQKSDARKRDEFGGLRQAL
jgi:hypothetical protein